MIPAFHYTLGEGFALARAAGFPAVDLDLREPRLSVQEVLDGLGEMRAATGRLPAYPGQKLDKRVPRYCREVGIRVLTCSVRPSLAEPRDLVPEYREWAAMLADEGLELAIESLTPLHLQRELPVPYVQTYSELQEFIGLVGAGLLYDTWHWHHGGYPLPSGMKILHVHLADAADQAPEDVQDGERLFAGEGVIDLPRLLSVLDGYTGFVSPEVFGGRGRFATPLERARHGYNTTVAALRR